MQRKDSAFVDILERYHKVDDEFLSHIVTGNETWALIVNIEIEEQSKQWIHTHSRNKPQKLNKLCMPES
jgi:hypothetical protein